uniref:Uncharacterized protein n=1 Tax=Cacopsylla melanoneura TaxID=428564 RepID=A0A8D9BT28_9HEMI
MRLRVPSQSVEYCSPIMRTPLESITDHLTAGFYPIFKGPPFLPFHRFSPPCPSLLVYRSPMGFEKLIPSLKYYSLHLPPLISLPSPLPFCSSSSPSSSPPSSAFSSSSS